MIVERWIKNFLKPLTFGSKHSFEQDLVNHVRVHVFLSAECAMHSAQDCFVSISFISSLLTLSTTCSLARKL